MLARELASPVYPFDEDAAREWVERQVDSGPRDRDAQSRQVGAGEYTDVYLDDVEPAAPWLIGEPKSAVPPKRLYEKLKVFEEYVAADIDDHQLSAPPDDEQMPPTS